MMSSSRVVLANALIYDGGSQTAATADLVVADGRVHEIGVGLDGDTVLDLSGCSITPGVVDAHVHLMSGSGRRPMDVRTPLSYRFFDAVRTLEATLEGGVTVARDASGADAGLRLALRHGLLRGPRVYVAVRMLHSTGGNGDSRSYSGVELGFPVYPGSPATRVDGADAARRVARDVIRAGADVLKISATGSLLSPTSGRLRRGFADDELLAIVAEADAAGLPTMAHAQLLDGTKAAIRAGVTSIEHGVQLDDEAVELMLAHRTTLVPTLSASYEALRRARREHPEDSARADRVRQVIETHTASFALAVRAGVEVAMGSDAGSSPHGRNLTELEWMTKHGLSPMAAWRAATRVGAELVGARRYGRLEPGWTADLCVFEGDFREVAGLSDRLRQVWQGGRLTVERDSKGDDDQ